MTKNDIIDELKEALSFYANPDSYFAISFLSDPSCGEFINDFDKEHEFTDYTRPVPGKRAIQALKKVEGE